MEQIKEHEAKLDKIKEEEMERRKKALELKKIKDREDEKNRQKKETHMLEREFEKKKSEIRKHMQRLKVTCPDGIISRVNEMKAIKEGLLELTNNYKSEIKTLSKEVEELKHKKNQQNTQNDDKDDSHIDRTLITQRHMVVENENIKRSIHKLRGSPLFSANPVESFEITKDFVSSPEFKGFDMKNKLELYEKNLGT